MNIQERYKERINSLNRHGCHISNETENAVVLENEETGELFTILIDEAFEQLMEQLTEIQVVEYRKEIYEGEDSYKLYHFVYQYNGREFLYELYKNENKIFNEYISYKDTEWKFLNKTTSINLKDEHLKMIKSIVIQMRALILNKKEYRLRNLFRPFEWADRYNWMLEE